MILNIEILTYVTFLVSSYNVFFFSFPRTVIISVYNMNRFLCLK